MILVVMNLENSKQEKLSSTQLQNTNYSVDQIVNLILKDVEFTKKMDRKVIEKQERTWLQFGDNIPRKVKKEIPPIIKEKTGYHVKWLKDGSLVIEFFTEDELAEIRHRRLNIQTPPVEIVDHRKKQREPVPKPHNRRMLSSFPTKSYR